MPSTNAGGSLEATSRTYYARKMLRLALLLLLPLLCLLLASVARPLEPRRCSAAHHFDPDVKVIRDMHKLHVEKQEIKTRTGKRCAFLSATGCSAGGQIDGTIWDGTQESDPRSDHADRRNPSNEHEIWFVSASEANAPPYRKRPIGDVDWMAGINYARHYGANADFPRAAVFSKVNTNLDVVNRTWTSPNSALLSGKTHWILYLSSNCYAQSERDDFVRRASLFMDIDSVGACAHNKDVPLRLKALEEDSEGNNIRSRWGDYSAGSRAILGSYHFRLVIISTLCEDYFAEKILQTLDAGVIPIYLGMPNSHDWDPGIAAGVHPALIHVQDFDGLSELAEFVLSLGAHDNDAHRRRLRYFEYQSKPPVVFPRHRERWLNKTGGADLWYDFVCLRAHDGNPRRRIDAQFPCHGSWWQYFKSIGKNLTQWGCTPTRPCPELTTPTTSTTPYFSRHDYTMLLVGMGCQTVIIFVLVITWQQRKGFPLCRPQ
jgi:hypothetical protein